MDENQTDLEDKPLDPATEKVRRKMVRLLAVSIGVMMVGLMAVLGAIVYKLGQTEEPEVASSKAGAAPVAAASQLVVPETVTAENMLTGEIGLPSGAKLTSSSLDGDRVLLTVQLSDGSTELHIFDLVSGQIFVQLRVR